MSPKNKESSNQKPTAKKQTLTKAACSAQCPHCSAGFCCGHTGTTPNYHTCGNAACGKHWVV